MVANLIEREAATALRTVLDAADEVYVINPSAEVIEELVALLHEERARSVIRLLADARTLKATFADFVVASQAADLVASGVLALRTDDEATNTLLVTDEQVVALVDTGELIAGLASTDAEFVASTTDHYDELWADADAFTLRTPPISRVRETLTDAFGDGLAADFDGVLASLEAVRGNGDGFDEVAISLLVAARHEELFYDISRWGEDVGVASKATFSRTKTRLEELGLVETEKVPIDVGRPRLRLLLGDDRLRDADADQLASVAQSILAS